MKVLMMLFIGVFCSAFLGFSIAETVGFEGEAGAMIGIGVSIVASFLPQPTGVLSTQLYNDLVVKVITDKLQWIGTWVELLMTRPKWLSGKIIKVPKEGTDVDGVINNTVWPLTADTRSDEFDTLELDRFDTKPRKIDREEMRIPYDVKGSEIRYHRRKLEKMSQSLGLHGLAPASHSATTPLLETTGADDGTGRKRLIRKDLIRFKAALKAAGYDKDEDWLLVLSAEHVEDLEVEDDSFAKTLQHHNSTTGELAKKFHNFILREDSYRPVYDNATLTKKAYGAVEAADDRNASVFVYLPRAVRAKGEVNISSIKVQDDPYNKQNVLSTHFWNIITGFGGSYSGAIIDGRV